MKVRRATITISDDLLMRALHMPAGCKIIGGQVCNSAWRGVRLDLVVEDDGLPEVDLAEGESLPEVIPKVTYEPERWTWDWNIDDDKEAGE